MPVSRDIRRTYRAPRAVVRELMGMGVREDRAIVWLMLGCLIVFVSRLPALQRNAVLNGADFVQDGAYAFLGLLMIAPLLFYGIAAVAQMIARVLGRRTGGYGARVAIFWGWLAASPVGLLYGLLAGFNGPEEPGTAVIGGVWLLVIVVFWIQGLRAASEPIPEAA